MSLDVDDIVEFFVRIIVLVELGKIDATAGAAAIIRVDNSLSFRRHGLSRSAVVRHPAIGVMRFRAAMHKDNQWIATSFLLKRMDQNGLELQAVARGIGNRLLFCQLALTENRIRVRQAFGLGAITQ